MNRRSSVPTLVLLAAVLGACSSETVAMWPAAPVHFLTAPSIASAASPTTPTNNERGLADSYMNALASPGFVELGPIVDEEVRFVLGARNTHGRDRVLKVHDEALGAFDQRHFVANRVWLTDSTRPLDSQALEWTMTGIHARPFLGVAPTNKPVVIKGLTLLWTSDSGIISDLHVYFDEELIRAQLGGGPADLQKVPTPPADAETHQTYERTGAPEEATNVALVRAMIQALEDGQETSFLATFDDKLEITSLDHAEPARGKLAARQYFQTMRGSIRHLDTVIQNVWGAGSFAVVEYAITGLQQAPLPRIPFAAGRPLHTQFVDIAEIKDGRIAHIWRYADPIAFASL
jgi:ketosteroid isomerase-like protein